MNGVWKFKKFVPPSFSLPITGTRLIHCAPWLSLRRLLSREYRGTESDLYLGEIRRTRAQCLSPRDLSLGLGSGMRIRVDNGDGETRRVFDRCSAGWTREQLDVYTFLREMSFEFWKARNKSAERQEYGNNVCILG